MGSISKPYTFSANTTASSSQVNADFDTIYNDYNGNISATNLAADAVTTAKIADSNVTTAKINDSAITTAKINNDAVTAAKIDWASTGADAGIWWEEIGRTTLGVAGDTITVSSLPARKYLKVLISTIATGGTNTIPLQFNSDTGNNYSVRESSNGGADSTTTSTSSMRMDAGAIASPIFAVLEIVNISAQEKLVIGHSIIQGTAGAGSSPSRKDFQSKWANTSAQISSVTFTNTGTGDYAIGSEAIVLGHN